VLTLKDNACHPNVLGIKQRIY